MRNLLEGILNLFHLTKTSYNDEDSDLNEIIDYLQKIEGNKLLPVLKLVINSLEKDIVLYDWSKQCSCNCGLVIQAILNTDKDTVEELFDYVDEENSSGRTWRDSVKEYCNASGFPTHTVFQLLYSKGFKPEDIVHLEYLSNPAILEISGINTKDNYYQEKDNLVLYLKAWVQILEHKEKETVSNRGKLEANLLRAVYEEDFEKAALIRDQIQEIV